MASSSVIKPTHKAIKQYYQSLSEYSARKVTHEGAVETAFQRLLDSTARSHHWHLIPKQKLKVGKATVFPDGTLRDLFNARCGYWEAKDSKDDLEKEISKKLAAGYPTGNTIFEDTRQAVLYQGGQERGRFDLTDPKQLANLLNDFFSYTEPEIEDFHTAVDEFKEAVPDLARKLVEIIDKAHQSNRAFQKAFADFFTLCQQTLNPNISQAAVDEMLVQHLLTERLIRKVFDNPGFTRRNVIAAEIEKVIDALVSLSFNRDSFLKSLDRFYRAIENAAHTLEDFSEKQQFLNTVYERFFQGYSVKVADTHGIVYTPQAIVDFMCASVEEVLKTEFGLTLSSKGVNILDPCTGTGNFIVNLIRRIPKRDLPRVYKEQLFANEVMLLPYYIAALNIEHANYEITGQYESFEGLCFVDTLDLIEEKATLKFMTEKNAERVERQKRALITVIIGNPPYNVGQLNENDNNKNRKYPVIDKRINGTYAKASNATLNTKLYDAYVKFFRWAVDRLSGDGIVCFVSNNSFIDQIAFDGMRKHLFDDFTRIYHLHLEGNVRENPKLSGTAYNVFGIQVGVGITVAIRSAKHKDRRLFFERVDKNLRKEEKLLWIEKLGTLSGVRWERLAPDDKNTWLVAEHADEFAGLLALGSKQAKATVGSIVGVISGTYSLGVSTNRDRVVYDFDKKVLGQRVSKFCDDYNAEIDRFRRKGKGANLDDFLDYSQIKWSRNLKRSLRNSEALEFDESRIRFGLYRPFVKQYLYFADIAVDELGQFPRFFPTTTQERENQAICVSTIGYRAGWGAIVSDCIANLNMVSVDGFQCFPFYVYDVDGSNRRENITDWALNQFRTHYGQSPLADARDSEKEAALADARGLDSVDARDSETIPDSEPRALASGLAGEEPLPHGRGSEKTMRGSEKRTDSEPRALASGGEPLPHGRRSEALTYFITFHTYGTWLHGRAEGSVDREHNVPNTPFLTSDEEREQAEFRRLKVRPVTLNSKARGVVEQTVQEVCAYRKWTLHAVNVRTNHVHVVVTAMAQPEKVMNDFKAYGTRRLVEARCVPAKSKVWARHGSTRYIWDEGSLEDRCKYVVEGQGPDLPTGELEAPLPHGRGSEMPDREITKWDIFYYVYGLLHHPGYRTKFADNLKRELPRIPFAPPLPHGRGSDRSESKPRASASGFWAFAKAGKELARLHLDYEKMAPYELRFVETPGVPLSYRIEDKMRLSKDKTSLKVNPSLTLAGIPPETFQYRLGNRSALDWVIDQYQVSEDKRSGIKSDPNRTDDEEYIVRLVGQVIRVSLETVRIVNGLPERYSAEQ